MRARAKIFYMAEQRGHRCGAEMVVIRRAVVDHEIERRQARRIDPGRAISRSQRPCALMTRLATAQLYRDRRFDATRVLRIQLRTQIVDYASIAIAERENCSALDAINVAHDKQFFDSRIEADARRQECRGRLRPSPPRPAPQEASGSS